MCPGEQSDAWASQHEGWAALRAQRDPPNLDPLRWSPWGWTCLLHLPPSPKREQYFVPSGCAKFGRPLGLLLAGLGSMGCDFPSVMGTASYPRNAGAAPWGLAGARTTSPQHHGTVVAPLLQLRRGGRSTQRHSCHPCRCRWRHLG